jgi:hypothetical protein
MANMATFPFLATFGPTAGVNCLSRCTGLILALAGNGEISVFFWGVTGRETSFLGELVQSANLSRMLDVPFDRAVT